MKRIIPHPSFSPLLIVLIFMSSMLACGAPASSEPTAVEEAPVDQPTYLPATQVPIPLTATPGLDLPDGVEPAPALPEFRRLTLEFPPSIKAGAESDIIRLTLEVDELGSITPTAEFEGNVVEGEVIEIPNLYATHNVTAEAIYEVAGLEVKPSGATFQPLKQGKKLTFYWSIRAQEVGTYRGTIWLHLNFDDRSSGEKSRVPVSAQVVEIEAVDFFGFSTNFVRTSGVVGSVLGSVLGFPFFKEIVMLIFRRDKKNLKRSAKNKPKK